MRRYGWVRLVSIASVGIILEVLCRRNVISRLILIPPSEMLASAWQILASGEINADLYFSLVNLAFAIGLSVVGGFLTGLAIYSVPLLRSTLEPFLTSYSAVPPIVFYPMLIVIFGLNRIPEIIIAVMFGLVPMAMNTINGLYRIRPVFLKVGRAHRVSAFASIVRIQLPAAAPYLFVGATLAVSYSVIGVISTEFILSASGIGHQISFAYDNYDNRTMYGLVVLLLVIATLLNTTLRLYSQRMLQRWTR
ncbi:MAG TPA: ABC transporter permease subunit [Candidatus Acidoferrales bacterium]|jgi:NitT/TauT family transport system permease protein|nr:ABC transporter permease subunit [Candidatus Acidoferrales bacterium]